MLPYEKIFNRTLGKIDDPKELHLEVSDLLEIYVERLHEIVGDPRVSRLFTTIILNDEEQELEYELVNPMDEIKSDEFVIKLLSLGMVIEWLQPKVDSIMYTSLMIGGKEEKKILDNHKNMIERLNSLKVEQKKLIRDYDYQYNSYLSGN